MDLFLDILKHMTEECDCPTCTASKQAAEKEEKREAEKRAKKEKEVDELVESLSVFAEAVFAQKEKEDEVINDKSFDKEDEPVKCSCPLCTSKSSEDAKVRESCFNGLKLLNKLSNTEDDDEIIELIESTPNIFKGKLNPIINHRVKSMLNSEESIALIINIALNKLIEEFIQNKTIDLVNEKTEECADKIVEYIRNDYPTVKEIDTFFIRKMISSCINK